MQQHIPSIGHLLIVTAQRDGELSPCSPLADFGHELMITSSSDEALAIATSQLPDLILLDLPISDLSSVELLDTLSEYPHLQHIPVIILTATPDQRRLLRAFDAGAVDCITKPCEPDELLARVNVHLRLKLTRDRLAQVARERQELVTLVAHDLKNPLTSVLFACEMLALPDCKPERVPRYLQIIDDSTHDALGYIRCYLESQSKPNQSNVAPDCAHLSDTLQWLAARYELQIETAGMRLSLDTPEHEACVAIRGQVLRQLGENLISNALKYASSGGELTLVARQTVPGYWQLLVLDRGPGIPDSFQQQLFQPFQRLHRHDAAAAQSNGLGLALAKQIAVNAGGRLWYEDRDGGGACFTLELPATTCNVRCA